MVAVVQESEKPTPPSVPSHAHSQPVERLSSPTRGVPPTQQAHAQGNTTASTAAVWSRFQPRQSSATATQHRGSSSSSAPLCSAKKRRGPSSLTGGDDDLEVGAGSEKNPKKDRRKRPRLASWPPLVAHFLGYRQPEGSSKSPPFKSIFRHVPSHVETAILTFLATFVSMIVVACIASGFSLTYTSLPLSIGALGATAVLLYAAPLAPFSQPRNCTGGHLLSSVVGVCISYLFSLSDDFYTQPQHSSASTTDFAHLVPIASALSVSISVALMQLTGTLHPPGGATALLASSRPTFKFVALIMVSVTAMQLWALVVNNLGHRGRYPAYWWKEDEGEDDDDEQPEQEQEVQVPERD